MPRSSDKDLSVEEKMSDTFTPGPTANAVRAADGKVLTVPNGWVLLPPGDAALTRRVKAAGDHLVVQEKKGRKIFSRGVWAPAETIDRIRAELEVERRGRQQGLPSVSRHRLQGAPTNPHSGSLKTRHCPFWSEPMAGLSLTAHLSFVPPHSQVNPSSDPYAKAMFHI